MDVKLAATHLDTNARRLGTTALDVSLLTQKMQFQK